MNSTYAVYSMLIGRHILSSFFFRQTWNIKQLSLNKTLLLPIKGSLLQSFANVPEISISLKEFLPESVLLHCPSQSSQYGGYGTNCSKTKEMKSILDELCQKS